MSVVRGGGSDRSSDVAGLSGCSSHQQSSTATSTSPATGAQTLTAQLHTAENQSVATATFEFANGYATVTVKTTQNHILEPGFHALHVHEIGKCEPNSVGAEGGRREISCRPVCTIRRPGTPASRRVVT